MYKRQEYGGKIINQLHKMGASADWERERFTMDEGCSKAVEEVFVRLYEKGYIYKGSRIINWCPVCQTSISDAEVEHEDQDGFFWHINYPIVEMCIRDRRQHLRCAPHRKAVLSPVCDRMAGKLL